MKTDKKLKRYKRVHKASAYCFDVVKDNVSWPNGKRLDRDLIVHGGISVMVPFLDEKHIILIRQYRYGAGRNLWELPAGTIDKGETPLACAKREIEEEIGYTAAKWKKIISFYPTPGYNTQVIHCFEARNLKESTANLEEDEILRPKVFSIREVKKMLRDKKIIDGKSIAPLMYAVGAKS